jgi:cytochrome P450
MERIEPEMTITLTTGTAPRALPLFGHSLAFGRRPLDFMSSLPAHGDLVQIKLGPWLAYVVCHPDLVHQVLVEDRTFDKGGPLFEKACKVLGNGLATCPHLDHRRQRRLIQPAFHHERIPGYARVMAEQITSATQHWHDGQVIDVIDVMNTLATAIATRTLFSAEVEESILIEIQQCVLEVLGGIARRMVIPWEILDKVPTPGNRTFNRARDRLKYRINELVTNYRRAGVDHGDMLSMMLADHDHTRDGEGLSDSEVHDQVMTFYLAGSETIATVLSWVWYLLGQHPDVRARLHEEVDTVLDHRAAEYHDIPTLGLTSRIVTETLRIYPPVWMLTRRTTTDTTLAGRHLPAGTIVVFSPYLLHHRPDLYPQPHQFDPDRWRDSSRLPPRSAYIPFGGGARKCIGDDFGVTGTILALASIATHWQLDPIPRAHVRPGRRAVLAPHSLRMRLRQRGDHPPRGSG